MRVSLISVDLDLTSAEFSLSKSGSEGISRLTTYSSICQNIPDVISLEYNPEKKEALVGDGKIKWTEVFDACENVAGTQWYIVEEESGFYKGLDGIDLCYKALKKLLS